MSRSLLSDSVTLVITLQAISHPNSSQIYVQCIYGVPNVMFAVDGTLFDPESLWCEVVDNVKCT